MVERGKKGLREVKKSRESLFVTPIRKLFRTELIWENGQLLILAFFLFFFLLIFFLSFFSLLLFLEGTLEAYLWVNVSVDVELNSRLVDGQIG